MMRLFIISLFVVMSLTICADAVAEEPLPYKATTVDECINEKECVWYYLSALAKTFHYNAADANVARWEKPIKIRMRASSGTNSDQGQKYLVNALAGIIPHMKQEVSFQEEFNYLIIFSNNLKNEYQSYYQKDLQRILGKDIESTVANVIEGNYEGCFSITVDHPDKKGIYGAITFIEQNSDAVYFERCVTAQIYHVLGMRLPLSSDGKRVLDAQKKYGGKASPLEKLLVEMLYSKAFYDGLKMDELFRAFYIEYPRALEKVKKINQK